MKTLSDEAINRSLYGRSLSSVRLFQSVVPASIPQTLHSTKKIRQPKNRQPHFFRCSFLIFTRSLPAFGRAIASTIPLHSVTLRKLRYTAFQPYHACRPPLFSGCSFRTAIGVGSAPSTLYDQFTFLVIINCKLSIINWFSRFALNHGTPKAAVYFFPAVSRSLPLLSLRPSARSRVHGGGSIAATPPTALLTKNSVKTPFLFRCWGVFDCLARKKKRSKHSESKT